MACVNSFSITTKKHLTVFTDGSSWRENCKAQWKRGSKLLVAFTGSNFTESEPKFLARNEETDYWLLSFGSEI
jgi:hypothetical protein